MSSYLKLAIVNVLALLWCTDIHVVDRNMMGPLHCVCASSEENLEPLFDYILKKQ